VGACNVGARCRSCCHRDFRP